MKSAQNHLHHLLRKENTRKLLLWMNGRIRAPEFMKAAFFGPNQGANCLQMLNQGIRTAVTRIRHWYYYRFRKGYVQRQLARRKGVCGRHGCCDLDWLARLRHRRCLDPLDRTKCLKWGSQPSRCKAYPFDEKDKKPATRSYCAFYWKVP